MKLKQSIRLLLLWSVSSTFFIGALDFLFSNFFMKLYIVLPNK